MSDISQSEINQFVQQFESFLVARQVEGKDLASIKFTLEDKHKQIINIDCNSHRVYAKLNLLYELNDKIISKLKYLYSKRIKNQTSGFSFDSSTKSVNNHHFSFMLGTYPEFIEFYNKYLVAIE